MNVSSAVPADGSAPSTSASVSRRTVLRRGLLGVTAGGLALGGGVTGCDRSTADSITVFIGTNANFPTQQRAWMSRIGTEFARRTGGRLSFQTYASGTQELQQLQTAVIAQAGPDVWHIGTTFTPTCWSSASFESFDAATWAEVGGRDRFFPASLTMSAHAGENAVGVPYLSRPFVLAYNTELFRAAGIDSPATTWDGLVEDAKRLTRGAVHGIAVAYQDGFDPWKFIWMFARQSGNALVEGDRATLDSEVVVAAYRAYFDFLVTDHIVDPAAISWSGADSLAAFATGKAAMLLMTTASALPTLATSSVGTHFAFAPMPLVPPGATRRPAGGVPAASIVSGDNLVVSSFTERKDLALAYIDLVTSTAEQIHYTQVFGDLPTNAAAAAAIDAAKPVVAPVLTAGRESYPTPFTGAWSVIQLGLVDITTQSLPELAAGSVPTGSIRSRLSALQDAAQKSLDRERDR